jgi:hypothetical protein
VIPVVLVASFFAVAFTGGLALPLVLPIDGLLIVAVALRRPALRHDAMAIATLPGRSCTATQTHRP